MVTFLACLALMIFFAFGSSPSRSAAVGTAGAAASAGLAAASAAAGAAVASVFLALAGLALAQVIGPWGYLGLIVLATGVFRFCGAYTLLGVNTCPMKKEEA